jgi:formylmethanofuran dehydrogenase subunit C
MSIVTLTLKSPPLSLRVDVSSLLPHVLESLSVKDMESMSLMMGNRNVNLGELFSVAKRTTDTAQAILHIVGDAAKLDHIGAAMQGGMLIVEGDAGDFAGRDMRSGNLHIHGSSGLYTACSARNGAITIDSNAGDWLGAPMPGNTYGLRGATVIVRGNAGARAGERMRRGLICIDGNAAEFCASRMVAGTICVAGTVGQRPCVGLLHGSLLLTQEPEHMLPSFGDCGVHEFGFLKLLAPELAKHRAKFAKVIERSVRARRFAGDLAVDGRGELLVCK